MRNKEKLGLIDEYIKVVQILNFLVYIEKFNLTPNKYIEKIKGLIVSALQLKSLYNSLFDNLNMNDLSMQILLKDLDNVDYDRFIRTIDISNKIADYEDILEITSKKVNEKYSGLIEKRQDLGIS